ncbi:MAG: hypothetical protein AAF909_09105 [Pseudomonadota bacterium]
MPTPLTFRAAAIVALGLATPTALTQTAAAEEAQYSQETPKEVRFGEDINGYEIRKYVFIYADLDNDGVLRGKEIRRARRRAVQDERGRDRRH